MMAAPRSTPLQPKAPNSPVLGGMKGVRFSPLHVRRAERDEDHQHHDLDQHQRGVGVGRLPDADDEQRR